MIRDALRNRVETESQGNRTILYTATGQPNYMYVIPRFTLDEVSVGLGKTVHPVFIINGEVKSEFFYGCYPGSIQAGELLSQPNKEPASQRDLVGFQLAAARNGRGWHVSTNVEWAALTLLCRHSQWQEQGNTDYGRNYRHHDEIARRLDNIQAGEQEGVPTTFTGSGPASWYHNGDYNGIGDLCGNLWEWQNGMRLVAGEIQIIPDNNAAIQKVSSTDPRWRAIDLHTGALISPRDSYSAKFDAPIASRTANAGTPILNTVIQHFNGDPQDNGYPAGLMDAEFGRIQIASDIDAPLLLKILGIIPHSDCDDGDQVYLRNYSERNLLRGGAWYSGRAAGMRTLCLSHGASHLSTSVGARPAFLN